jgi:hypothetical protein
MKNNIASEPAAQLSEPVTPTEAWTGVLLITPDQVQQILDANAIADATEEQA